MRHFFLPVFSITFRLRSPICVLAALTGLDDQSGDDKTLVAAVRTAAEPLAAPIAEEQHIEPEADDDPVARAALDIQENQK